MSDEKKEIFYIAFELFKIEWQSNSRALIKGGRGKAIKDAVIAASMIVSGMKEEINRLLEEEKADE